MITITLRIEQLEAMGFDRCNNDDGDDRIKVGCSQCAALVIYGTPCHESRCPNASKKCRGCDAMIRVNRKYCDDCS